MKIAAVLAAVLLTCLAQGQQSKFDRSLELGLCFGTSYYLGELNPYRHFGTRLQPGGGLSFRSNPTKRWSFKTSMLYGKVVAHDSDSKDPWMANRNLHFRNRFFEGSLQAELNYFNYQIANHDDWISPYLFAGLAFYSMKPQAEYKGTWYELQPLGTEGQGNPGYGKKYNTSAFAVPFGVGLKMNIYAIFGLSLEWGMRRTWTDYFDDVSGRYLNPVVLEDLNGQLSAIMSDRSLSKEGPGGTNEGMMRGDPGRKDWYSFALLSLQIRVDKPPTNCWGSGVRP